MKQRTRDFFHMIALWVLAGLFVCLALSIDGVRERLDKLETLHTESENEH